jgi:hypothetical protein
MDKKEIIRRLKRMSEHAVYMPGKPPFIMSLDDSVVADEAAILLKEQESVIEAIKSDLDETLKVLGEQPEIIRCRDCKRKGTLSCPKAPVRPDDWFCADGERR